MPAQSLTTGNIIELIVLVCGIASMWGSIMARIAALEKKQDKHNNIYDRLTSVEESTKSAHKRIDELHEEIRDISHKR
jgi:cell division protein FtsL